MNQELQLPSGLLLKNRLAKAAMTEGLADSFQRPSAELCNLYRTWARESGVGMLITGNIQVDKRFVERPRNVVIDSDFGEPSKKHFQKLQDFASSGQENESRIIAQISHGGRQATHHIAKKVLAPSAIKMKSGTPITPAVSPVEASLQQIREIVDKFAFTARVLQDAGFDGVQIHAAHGYLISSFISPKTNKRRDIYGGSLENRARLLIDVVRAVKQATQRSPFSIGVKLNSSDFQKGGIPLSESIDVALMLSREEIDFLEISGGNFENPALLTGNIGQDGGNKPESTIRREAYFLSFAEEIVSHLKQEDSNIAIMVTGGFRSAVIINEAIESGTADLIGIGRPLCVDPGCTKELLEGNIHKLVGPEESYSLPSLLGWSYLQRFTAFRWLRMAATQMTLYSNLIELGKGTYDNRRDMNIIMKTISVVKTEENNARTLRGYNRRDEFIQDYLKIR